MKKSLLLSGWLLALFAAANSFAGTSSGDSKLLDVLIDKDLITEEEALEIRQSSDDGLKISGMLFMDFTHYDNHVGPAAFSSPVTRTGVNINRAYLTADYDFDETWMLRLRTDVNQAFNATTLRTEQDVFFKNAFISGNFSRKLSLEVGIIDTPWIVYEEALWKRRYVSKVLTDTADGSSDAGLAVKGHLAGDFVEYHLAAVNGGGYQDLSASKTLDLDSRLSLKPLNGLTIDFQIREGYGGTKTETAEGIRTNLDQVMSTYGPGNYRVGVNYFEKDTDNRATSVTQESEGYGLWGWLDISSGIGLFARYEQTKVFRPSNAPSSLPSSIDKDRYVLGIDYPVTKGIAMAFALDHSKTDNPSLLRDFYRKEQIYGFYIEAKF